MGLQAAVTSHSSAQCRWRSDAPKSVLIDCAPICACVHMRPPQTCDSNRLGSSTTRAAAGPPAMRRAAPAPMHAHAAMLAARRASHAAASTSAASAPAPPAAGRGLLVTLERSVSGDGAADEALLATGAFAAEVFPDLPIATTWAGLYKALLGWVVARLGRRPVVVAGTLMPASSSASPCMHAAACPTRQLPGSRPAAGACPPPPLHPRTPRARTLDPPQASCAPGEAAAGDPRTAGAPGIAPASPQRTGRGDGRGTGGDAAASLAAGPADPARTMSTPSPKATRATLHSTPQARNPGPPPACSCGARPRWRRTWRPPAAATPRAAPWQLPGSCRPPTRC